jgi:aminoglycoside phosphotransferase (APT) family kinase protein
MSSMRRPASEHPIDPALVRGLLADQHPDLAHLPLREIASGWDNLIYRLGDAWCVRLPRRALGARLIAHEQRWLPELAARLPLPVPVPVRHGRPGRGYPWRWSVCAWLEGDTAAEASLDLPQAMRDMAGFVAALHAPAAADAPPNPYRGGALSSRSDLLRQHLAVLGDALDGRAVRERWTRALAAPAHSGPPVWLHGDLHPANLVVCDGRLAGVIDFGDLTGGDPATDLAVAWMLLPAELRASFRAELGDVDEATWRRARGWALSHAIACLASSSDDPRMRGVGAKTLAAVLEDPED